MATYAVVVLHVGVSPPPPGLVLVLVIDKVEVLWGGAAGCWWQHGQGGVVVSGPRACAPKF